MVSEAAPLARSSVSALHVATASVARPSLGNRDSNMGVSSGTFSLLWQLAQFEWR
jgi:hypothetical protein